MWNPGTLVFLSSPGIGILVPHVKRCQRIPIWKNDGLTCTVLCAEPLSFGTQGRSYRYTLLADCTLYTVEIDDADMIDFFEVIQET